MNEYYNPNNQGEYNNPNTQQNYYNQNTQPQQPPYQAPVYQPINQTNEVMSVGSYIGMFLLSAIPVVNIICWIVWLVSPNTNKNKKNYIIANIVIYAVAILIGIVFSILASTVFGVALYDYLQSYGISIPDLKNRGFFNLILKKGLTNELVYANLYVVSKH